MPTYMQLNQGPLIEIDSLTQPMSQTNSTPSGSPRKAPVPEVFVEMDLKSAVQMEAFRKFLVVSQNGASLPSVTFNTNRATAAGDPGTVDNPLVRLTLTNVNVTSAEISTTRDGARGEVTLTAAGLSRSELAKDPSPQSSRPRAAPERP